MKLDSIDIYEAKSMNLSIIVPVYNMAGDGKLNYCMDSLVKQTITDYEIIAVDDALGTPLSVTRAVI